jgi:uncharacterized protein
MSDRNIEEILQSTSDCLFPDELGQARVNIDSTDGDGDTPLHVLIGRDDTEAALCLIAGGAPIDAVGDMGETPLHVAISRKNTKVIKALLEAGAKTDSISEFGQTAKAKAIQYGVELEHPGPDPG